MISNMHLKSILDTTHGIKSRNYVYEALDKIKEALVKIKEENCEKTISRRAKESSRG